MAGKVELGYMLLPEAWGHGYATEACAAKLGLTEVKRFEAYGAEQWCGVWPQNPGERPGEVRPGRASRRTNYLT